MDTDGTGAASEVLMDKKSKIARTEMITGSLLDI